MLNFSTLFKYVDKYAVPIKEQFKSAYRYIVRNNLFRELYNITMYYSFVGTLRSNLIRIVMRGFF